MCANRTEGVRLAMDRSLLIDVAILGGFDQWVILVRCVLQKVSEGR